MRTTAILGLAMLMLGSAARAEWRTFETAHFIIYSESNDKRASDLASRLESIDKLMHMATGLPDNIEPVKVRIYEMADEGAVQAAMNDDTETVYGFYRSNALGPYAVTVRRVIWGADGMFTPEVVLHHEYAHHFMLQYFPANYPTWYVEGFAELIGASKIMDDGTIAYGWPAKYRGNDIVADWVSLEDILAKPSDKVPPFDVYGQGWAMTHFFTFSKARSPQLRQYLAALSIGKSRAEAAKVFGDLGKLNREARDYVRQGSFEYRPVKVTIAQPVVQRVSPVAPAEAALIPETVAFSDFDLGWIRKPGALEKEREQRTKLLERIRRKAAQFASDPYALALLAEAENVAGNAAAAEAAADRLLAIQPNNVRALVRKSLLLSDAAAKLSGQARLDKAAEARRLAIRANKADPDEVLTYLAFYQSFHKAGVRPPNDAIVGLARAVEVLPDNTTVRRLLVDEFAAQRRWPDAIRVLAPLESDTHKSPLAQSVHEQMEWLKAQLAKDGGAAPGKAASST
jgi:tetratricopeptide (TPR) repeat protein